MSKYLFQVNYLGEGIKGLRKEGGTNRRAVVDRLFKSVGGSIEAFYFAYGETDLYIIADFPDDASVAAAVMTITSAGTATVKTTVLLLPEEIDRAGKKTTIYIPPGGNQQVPLGNG
jgi:uncharacterized protein with GYD domain